MTQYLGTVKSFTYDGGNPIKAFPSSSSSPSSFSSSANSRDNKDLTHHHTHTYHDDYPFLLTNSMQQRVVAAPYSKVILGPIVYVPLESSSSEYSNILPNNDESSRNIATTTSFYLFNNFTGFDQINAITSSGVPKLIVHEITTCNKTMKLDGTSKTSCVKIKVTDNTSSSSSSSSIYPPRLNTAGLTRSTITTTSSSNSLTMINPPSPVYNNNNGNNNNPTSTFSSGHGAFYNANNIYSGTSAAAAGGDAMMGAHNGYIQPGTYGKATASYHTKADIPIPSSAQPPAPVPVAAPSSSKAAAALAWESSRESIRGMSRPDYQVLGPGRGGSIGPMSGYYSGAAGQQYTHEHDYPLPPSPPVVSPHQHQHPHQHPHQQPHLHSHHHQLPSTHGRTPQGTMGSSLPMGAASHDYGQYVQSSGRMLPVDPQLAPSQAAGPRGYYNGPGMMSSVGTSNTSRGTGPMNDMNRGMYGMGKQSQPTQYRHY